MTSPSLKKDTQLFDSVKGRVLEFLKSFEKQENYSKEFELTKTQIFNHIVSFQ
jgi:hypothetical protein